MQQLSSADTWEFALRIVLACVCGGAIGFERTKRLKEAGIRTHCIIASAAALFMILSKYCFTDMFTGDGLYPGIRGADASRIAAQVVSGISFLGAGVIFRNGNAVKGLTTAAGIWATAAVGMSIGSGMYILGLVEAALIVVIQLVFHRFSIGNDAYSESEVRIVASDSEEFRMAFTHLLEERRIQLLSMRIERHGEGEVVYNLSIRTRQDFKVQHALDIFFNNPDVHSISM
ncbi:MAG: MgtC/SapB family protein [Clostridia bacterium]|nr:MgtC/SapB family protein [Clostridia bacterium]